MPRKRRVDTPDAVTTEEVTASAVDETPTPSKRPARKSPPAVQVETPPAAEAVEVPAEKPRRRPSRAKAANVTSIPIELEAPVIEAAEPAVIPSEPTAITAPASSRNRRRRGAKAAAANPALDFDASPEPASLSEHAPTRIQEVVATADASPSGRRSRGRKNAADSAPDAAQTSRNAKQDRVTAVRNAEESNLPRRKPTRRRGVAIENVVEPEPTPLKAVGESAITTGQNDISSTPAETEIPTSTQRRRRSRRKKDVIAEVSEVVESDLITPVIPEVTEEGEEGGRKSRRNRRGGRRRRGGSDDTFDISEVGDLIVDSEAEVRPEVVEEEEDDSLPLIAPPPPLYIAPPLVPVVSPVSEGEIKPRMAASVKASPTSYGRIVVNGHDYAPFSFFINAETASEGDVVDSQIHLAAANGIHFYSAVMYLPLRNAYGERSFGRIDALIQQILAADPEAYILPRLQFVPTNYWVRTHEDQLAHYADESEGDVSLASTEFWSDCVDALEALIRHFADPNTHGGDRVIGFHLDRGEWFYDAASGYDLSEPNRTAFRNWLHAKYQFTYALRAAWHDGSVTFETAEIPSQAVGAVKKTDTPIFLTAKEGRWADYATFSSDLVAQAITGLAAAVKTFSLNQLIVAVSYGYTLEFAARNDSGHLAMGKVLESEHIDILAGPNAYTGRGAGSVSAFGALIDSVALHNKLWVVEDDTKTFLAETETDDTYNPKIASGADTRSAHLRHFGAALAHKAGVCWMDLWGQGWLNNSDIWAELGGLRALADNWSKNSPAVPNTHDVIAFVDESSLAYIKTDPAGLGMNLIGKSRELLLKTGASVGFYLQSDVVNDNLPDATVYLFLNPLRLTSKERQAVREKLQRPGKTLAWLYAPGIFDENGPSKLDIGEVVGMSLTMQPWNSRVGSQLTELRHPITERVRSGKRIGQDEILNPSYSTNDPQATVLAEYVTTGAPSVAVREHASGWKSVFFGEPHLTVEILRGLFLYAGLPIFDMQDDVVYASNDGVLLVHTPYTGQRTIHLPKRSTVYDMLQNKILTPHGLNFRSFMRARTSHLFLWGAEETITGTTGLDLPAIQSGPPTRQESEEQELRQEYTDEQGEQTSDLETRKEEVTVVVQALAEIVQHIPGLDNYQEPHHEDGVIPMEQAQGELDAPSQPRSRWQRRRAAARARREAERAGAPINGIAASDGNGAAPPPVVDIATILPNLPPRRKKAAADAKKTEENKPRLEE